MLAQGTSNLPLWTVHGDGRLRLMSFDGACMEGYLYLDTWEKYLGFIMVNILVKEDFLSYVAQKVQARNPHGKRQKIQQRLKKVFSAVKEK